MFTSTGKICKCISLMIEKYELKVIFKLIFCLFFHERIKLHGIGWFDM